MKLFGSEKKDDKLFIILEFLPKGTLFDYIQKNNIDNKDITKIFIGLMDAVAYIHEKHIVHRDIKPENVIASDDGTFKLCDFGFAALYGKIRGR